jgi:hypothetical protein
MNNKVLDYNYASNEIKGYSNSTIAKNEKNDCFVRAVAAATGSNYDSAHNFVEKEFDRKEGKGTKFMALTMEKLEKSGFSIDNKDFKIKVLPEGRITNQYKLYGEVVNRKKTVKSFMKDNPEGTFIVGVSKHAFVVKDGMLIDNRGEEFRPTRKVDSVFQISGNQMSNQLRLF